MPIRFETALKLAEGIAIAEFADAEKDEEGAAAKNGAWRIFSEKFACPVSGFTIEEIEPRLFSFNNPYGACPTCDGLGTELHFEAELVVPDPTLSLRDGAILPWSQDRQYLALLHPDARGAGQALQVLDDDAMGEPAEEGARCHPLRHRRGRNHFIYDDGLRTYKTRRPSKASSAISSGAGGKPIRTGCARSWRATSRTIPAKPATVIA